MKSMWSGANVTVSPPDLHPHFHHFPLCLRICLPPTTTSSRLLNRRNLENKRLSGMQAVV
jgi:hypothetical protein